MGHGPPGKIKKSTIIGLVCEILYNFMSVLGFGWSKFPQSDVVAHPKNLNNSIIGLFCEALNNFSTALNNSIFKQLLSQIIWFTKLWLSYSFYLNTSYLRVVNLKFNLTDKTNNFKKKIAKYN